MNANENLKGLRFFVLLANIRVNSRPRLWLVAFFLCFPLLQGCTLLFVAQGGTHYSSSQTEKAPPTASLSREMNGRIEVEYVVQGGDNFASIAEAYYGKASKAGKIASANGLSLKSSLRAGTKLKIINPVYFPNSQETAAKAVPEKPIVKKSKPSPTPAVSTAPKVKQGLKNKSETPTSTPVAATPADLQNIDKVARPKGNNAFGPGEVLKFEIRALGILGGYASLEVGNYTPVNGRPCTPLIIRANSVFPLTGLYPVSDVQTSYFDTVDFLSWKFENNVHEGNYTAHNLETYDQLKHKMIRVHNADPPETLAVPPFTQDIISCFYYYRLLPLSEGKNYEVPTQSGGKNYRLIVKVGKREKITVPAGTFDCFKVRPLIQQGTVFRNNEEMDIWITADERHMPVKIQSGIVIGSIDVDLLDANLPKLTGR